MPRVKGKYGKKIVIKICQTPFSIIKQSRCKPVYRCAVHFGKWNKENILFLWIHLELSREKLDSYNFLHNLIVIQSVCQTLNPEIVEIAKSEPFNQKLREETQIKPKLIRKVVVFFENFRKCCYILPWHFPETSNWKLHLLAKLADGAGSGGIPLHQICCFIDKDFVILGDSVDTMITSIFFNFLGIRHLRKLEQTWSLSHFAVFFGTVMSDKIKTEKLYCSSNNATSHYKMMLAPYY